MERLNMNLPPEARATLARLAKVAKKRDAEYARELLLEALELAIRRQQARETLAAHTPARRASERRIAQAMEKLRG